MPRLSLDRLYAPEGQAPAGAKGPAGPGLQAGPPLKVSFAGLPPRDAADVESRAELIQAKPAGGQTARELRQSSQKNLTSGSLSARGWNDSTDFKPATYDGELPCSVTAPT